MELSALFGGHAGRGVESVVDRGREEGVELIVHHALGATWAGKGTKGSMGSGQIGKCARWREGGELGHVGGPRDVDARAGA